MKLFTRLAAATAVMLGMAAPAMADERTNPEELYFGILSTESSSAQREKWGPFLEAMESALGMPVKPFFAADYAGVIEGMRFDKVDVVWYGNKSAMVAVDRAGAEIFAQTTEATGDRGYWSVMVTHKDSGLTYEDVMSCDKSLDGLPACLDAMVAAGLLLCKDGQYSPPSPAQESHFMLSLLANLVSQALERMFIVIHELSEGAADREELRSKSQLVAQKISRLYGINAPEFSDPRLFDQFIDSLVAEGMLCADGDGSLRYDAGVEQVLRAAEFVIDPNIRHGVISASNQA